MITIDNHTYYVLKDQDLQVVLTSTTMNKTILIDENKSDRDQDLSRSKVKPCKLYKSLDSSKPLEVIQLKEQEEEKEKEDEKRVAVVVGAEEEESQEAKDVTKNDDKMMPRKKVDSLIQKFEGKRSIEERKKLTPKRGRKKKKDLMKISGTQDIKKYLISNEERNMATPLKRKHEEEEKETPNSKRKKKEELKDLVRKKERQVLSNHAMGKSIDILKNMFEARSRKELENDKEKESLKEIMKETKFTQKEKI